MCCLPVTVVTHAHTHTLAAHMHTDACTYARVHAVPPTPQRLRAMFKMQHSAVQWQPSAWLGQGPWWPGNRTPQPFGLRSFSHVQLLKIEKHCMSSTANGLPLEPQNTCNVACMQLLPPRRSSLAKQAALHATPPSIPSYMYDCMPGTAGPGPKPGRMRAGRRGRGGRAACIHGPVYGPAWPRWPCGTAMLGPYVSMRHAGEEVGDWRVEGGRRPRPIPHRTRVRGLEQRNE